MRGEKQDGAWPANKCQTFGGKPQRRKEIRFQKRLGVRECCSCCTLIVGGELNRCKEQEQDFIAHCPMSRNRAAKEYH